MVSVLVVALSSRASPLASALAVPRVSPPWWLSSFAGAGGCACVRWHRLLLPRRRRVLGVLLVQHGGCACGWRRHPRTRRRRRRRPMGQPPTHCAAPWTRIGRARSLPSSSCCGIDLGTRVRRCRLGCPVPRRAFPVSQIGSLVSVGRWLYGSSSSLGSRRVTASARVARLARVWSCADASLCSGIPSR